MRVHPITLPAALVAGLCLAPGALEARSMAALDVDLVHHPDMAPVVAEEAGRGKLMGSGGGRVRGLVDGDIRWTLFEVQEATNCELHLVGFIDTAGGETIAFESIGFGSRPAPDSSLWDMTASASFERGATPLSGRVAAWVGTFDADTGRSRYRVYLVSDVAGAGS